MSASEKLIRMCMQRADESTDEWKARIEGLAAKLADIDERLNPASDVPKEPSGSGVQSEASAASTASDHFSHPMSRGIADGGKYMQTLRDGNMHILTLQNQNELAQQLTERGFTRDTHDPKCMTHPTTLVEVNVATGLVRIKPSGKLTQFAVNTALAAMTLAADYRFNISVSLPARRELPSTPPKSPLNAYLVIDLINELETRTWGKDNAIRLNRLVQSKLTRVMNGDVTA